MKGYFKRYERWYSGTVLSADPAKDMYVVFFDDGDTLRLPLRRIRLCPGGLPLAGAAFAEGDSVSFITDLPPGAPDARPPMVVAAVERPNPSDGGAAAGDDQIVYTVRHPDGYDQRGVPQAALRKVRAGNGNVVPPPHPVRRGSARRGGGGGGGGGGGADGGGGGGGGGGGAPPRPRREAPAIPRQ